MPRHLLAAWTERLLWNQNEKITISFVNGTEHSVRLFKDMLEKFQIHVNLKFEYVDKRGTIRVQFKTGEHMSGSSLVGTEARVAQHENTIQFNFDIKSDWFNSNSQSEPKYSRYERRMKYVILHELAHVMGMKHDFARYIPLDEYVDRIIKYRKYYNATCIKPYTKEKCPNLWKMLFERTDATPTNMDELYPIIDEFVKVYKLDSKKCKKPYTDEKCPETWKNMFAELNTRLSNETDPVSVTNYYPSAISVPTELSEGDIQWLKDTYPIPHKKTNWLVWILSFVGISIFLTTVAFVVYTLLKRREASQGNEQELMRLKES